MGRSASFLLCCGIAAPLFGQAAAEAVLNRGNAGAKAAPVAPIGKTVGGAISRAGMDAPRAGSGNLTRTQGGSEMLVFERARRSSRSRAGAEAPPARSYEPLALASLKEGMGRDEVLSRFGPPQCSIVLSDSEIGEEQMSYTTEKGEFVDLILRQGTIARILAAPKGSK